MNPNSIEINIPAAIAVLPLAIGEKLVLARIAANPDCTNDELAKLLGITERGIKKVLQRLRSGGHTDQSGKGRARRLYLTFPVEQGTEFPNTEIIAPVSNGELRAPPDQTSATKDSTGPVLKKELSLIDHFDQTMNEIAEMSLQPKVFPETFVYLLERLIQRIEAEMQSCTAKEQILDDLYFRRNGFFVIAKASRLPKEFHNELRRKIRNATPEQLDQFHKRYLAAPLDRKSPMLLAAWADQAVVEVE